MLEIFRIENPTAIEQISRLSAGQQCRELTGSEFVQVENGDMLGLKVPDWMRIGGVRFPKRLKPLDLAVDRISDAENLTALPPRNDLELRSGPSGSSL